MSTAVGCKLCITAEDVLTASVDISWVDGDDVELVSVLAIDTDDDTKLNLRFAARVNGEAAEDSGVWQLEADMPTAWGGDPYIYLGDPIRPVSRDLERIYSVVLADTYTPAIEGDADTLLTELSGFVLGYNKEVLRVLRPEQPAIVPPTLGSLVTIEDGWAIDTEGGTPEGYLVLSGDIYEIDTEAETGFDITIIDDMPYIDD
jgi:hypothetical protein